jgi:hypothetical protein
MIVRMSGEFRIVERTFRAVNNLLEHFHAGYFFYLLPATYRKSTITKYYPALGLKIFSTSLKVLSLMNIAAVVGSLSIMNFSLMFFWLLIFSCFTMTTYSILPRLMFHPLLFMISLSVSSHLLHLIFILGDDPSAVMKQVETLDYMTFVDQLISALVKGVHEGIGNSHQWIVDNVMAYHLYNCWIWPFVSFVWVPAWMTQVVVSLSRS